MNNNLLELVYETTKAPQYDYLLLENTDNFDWDRFWEVFTICKQTLYPLYESFEKINSNQYTDLYEVVATNGMSFKLSISFYDKKHIFKEFLSTLYSNIEDKEELQKLQNAFDKTEHPILTINFQDKEGQIKTTNKLGNYAYSVVQGIKDAVIESIHARTKQLPDILYFYILKSEQKKLNFFINTIKLIFPNLKNHYIDQNSNKDFNLAYFYV